MATHPVTERLRAAPATLFARTLSLAGMERRLVHGMSWSVLGSAANRVALLLATLPVAHWVSQEEYGMLGIVQGTVGLLATFAGLSAGVTATRFVAQFREREPDRAGRVITLTLLVSCLCGWLTATCLGSFAEPLARIWFEQPSLGPLLVGACWPLALMTVVGAQLGVLAGLERFDALARSQIISGVILLPGICLGAYGFGLPGYLGAWALALLGQVLITQWVLVKACREHGIAVLQPGFWREARIIWEFSFPSMLSGILVGPVQWLAISQLARQEAGLDQMALYFAANQWFLALIFLPTLMSRVFMPRMAHALALPPRQRLDLVWGCLRTCALFALPVLVAGIAGAPWILQLYGPQYLAGWSTFTVSCATAAILTLILPIAQTLTAEGRVWIGLGMNLIWATCYLSLAGLFDEQGALGLALARLLAYVVHGLMNGLFLYWHFRGQGRSESAA